MGSPVYISKRGILFCADPKDALRKRAWNDASIKAMLVSHAEELVFKIKKKKKKIKDARSKCKAKKKTDGLLTIKKAVSERERERERRSFENCWSLICVNREVRWHVRIRETGVSGRTKSLGQHSKKMLWRNLLFQGWPEAWPASPFFSIWCF